MYDGTLVDRKLILAVLIVAFMAVSCTSYRVIELPDIKNRVRGSDIVRVVTTNGRKVKFKVTAITSDAIVGDNQRILFSDIATLEKQLYRGEIQQMSVAKEGDGGGY